MPKQLMRLYLFYAMVFSFIGFSMFFGFDSEGGASQKGATLISETTKKPNNNINVVEYGGYYTPTLLKEIDKKVADYNQQMINQQKQKTVVRKNSVEKKNELVKKTTVKEKSTIQKKTNFSSRVDSYLEKCNSRTGKFTLSHYNNNGGGGSGITASGKRTQDGYTASNNVLFGKTIKITLSNGTVMYRTVHDKGSERHMGYGNCKVDIFVNVSTAEVYRKGLIKGASIEIVN